MILYSGHCGGALYCKTAMGAKVRHTALKNVCFCNHSQDIETPIN